MLVTLPDGIINISIIGPIALTFIVQTTTTYVNPSHTIPVDQISYIDVIKTMNSANT